MAGVPELGFVIIGAQKAGTTSLFEYLRHHPEIHMPAHKEVGFFSSERNYARGWGWYRTVLNEGAPPGTVRGEASVGYMSGTVDRRGAEEMMNPAPPEAPTEDIVPSRIREHAPDAKLICVLRDPVARCLSHYRMAVLSRAEKRPFDEVIVDRLQPAALESARHEITGNNGYIARGEYHRILSGFWRAFPPEQLLTLFSSELNAHPAEVVSRVCEFVGVDPDYVPSNLEVRYREAALARRLPNVDLYAWQDQVSQVTLPRALWHRLPVGMRRRVDEWYQRASFRVDVWNARRGELTPEMPPHIERRLREHFRPDSLALSEALGVEVPWLAKWNGKGSLPTGEPANSG